MPRDKRDVEAALLNKGFRADDRDHRQFIYYSAEGKRTPIRTKTSHGTATKTLGDELISQMARQCSVTRAVFLQLVDCPLSRTDYEKLLRDSGKI